MVQNILEIPPLGLPPEPTAHSFQIVSVVINLYTKKMHLIRKVNQNLKTEPVKRGVTWGDAALV